MPIPPPVNPPRLANPLNPDQFHYVKRASADHQAAMWNLVLADDPILGPTTGMVVGVAPIRDRDGLWPLVWVRA